MAEKPLSYDTLRSALNEQVLFKDKTWLLSPEPFYLTQDQIATVEAIGVACYAFLKALNLLYRRSFFGKSILRNRQSLEPWVADYLNRGKPESFAAHALHPSNQISLPCLFRPDLLLTQDGIALTEIEVIPGGIGLTAFLNRHYDAFEGLIGGNEQFINDFYESLRRGWLRFKKKMHPKDNRQVHPEGLHAKSLMRNESGCCESESSASENPVMVIIVSEESDTYRPEFEWLSAVLRKQGKAVYCIYPDEVYAIESGLYFRYLGDKHSANERVEIKKIDIIYRFFELFDWKNIACFESICRAVEHKKVFITPPLHAFQEEKIGLALLHHCFLEDFWKENIQSSDFELLKKVVPKTWIVDDMTLPPGAILHAPSIRDKPMRNWRDLKAMTLQSGDYILKVSGFHETAWGARGVLLRSDSSISDWEKGIETALERSRETLSVLQEYRKPKQVRHSIYNRDREIVKMDGRVRLSPYYVYLEGRVQLSSMLATICPKDKKIIHGMRDATLVPVALLKSERSIF